MKKIVAFLLALTVALGASADDKSSALLAKMAAQIRGWKQYEVVFALRADASSSTVTGSYTVSGQRYGLKAGDREVFGDGALRYEVNHSDREVLIDKVNPKDKGILSDPTQVFDFPDQLFTHKYGGQMTWHGKKCDRIALVSKDAGSPISGVELYLDAATGLPAGVSYSMEGVSEPVEVEVVKIGPLATVPAGSLGYDKARYKGYEVIDFR